MRDQSRLAPTATLEKHQSQAPEEALYRASSGGNNPSIERPVHGCHVRGERAYCNLWMLQVAVSSTIVDNKDAGQLCSDPKAVTMPVLNHFSHTSPYIQAGSWEK